VGLHVVYDAYGVVCIVCVGMLDVDSHKDLLVDNFRDENVGTEDSSSDVYARICVWGNGSDGLCGDKYGSASVL